jgi:iron complex transport system ATP-binding protein
VLTSENIKTVFRVDALVQRHVVTNSLYVIPLSRLKSPAAKKCSIHLISGAGTGTALMKILLEEGYTVTAGVLNVLDTDFETAQFLKIPVITEAPFSPITEQAHKNNMSMIDRASMVVLTSVPFGHGNVQNLEAARQALEKGIPTFVIDELPIEKRDFTQGKATKLLSELRAKGASFVKNASELLVMLSVSEKRLAPAQERSKRLFDHLKSDGRLGKDVKPSPETHAKAK